jgi:2-C-methyl-D-erythritol 2,4-cyclodiphosphate synthase
VPSLSLSLSLVCLVFSPLLLYLSHSQNESDKQTTTTTTTTKERERESQEESIFIYQIYTSSLETEIREETTNDEYEYTMMMTSTISSSSSIQSTMRLNNKNYALLRNKNIAKTTNIIRNTSKSTVIKAAAAEPPVLPYRVGHGFDLHRLESTAEFPDLKLILGGIEVPHDRGCVAHSDGDVLLHCVVDAITGALGLPDIGQLFPDNDPKWKGQTSDVFVYEAIRLMKEAGYELGNIDCTLIAQRPKISPHKEKIKKNLAKLLDVHESVVNVKAKTHEKVDSLGENRSIACHTVVMLIKA